jgi:hypothetical protein
MKTKEKQKQLIIEMMRGDEELGLYNDKKAKVRRSKILQEIEDEMSKDPWYIKLRRWVWVKVWIYTCLTRKYWDKSYSGYIFKKR